MVKRSLLCLLYIVGALVLGGCWNYRGLDQMNIVVGIAVDFDKEKSEYEVSYEVADLLTAEKRNNIGGRIITSEGKTMFEAARNAKKKENNRLFFGSSYVLVISQQLAEEEGIFDAIEWFLRDGECRETMCVALSQEDSAGVILQKDEKMSGIMSSIIHGIITKDKKITASTIHIKLYDVYNMLKSKGEAAILPALHKTKNGDREVTEVNGSAVFKEDKLVGFLTPEESRYVLFTENKLEGGILTLDMIGHKTNDVSLEIFRSDTEKSFSYQEGRLRVKIESSIDASVAENHEELDVTKEEVIKKIEATAEAMIEEQIKAVVVKVQQEYQADIFGFGDMVYKRDLKLWEELEPRWDEVFSSIEIEVLSKVHIVNSGFIK